MLTEMAQKLLSARSVVLSTHRHCDGDGLGAQLALYHGLKKAGKTVRVLNVDPPPKKYAFLDTDKLIEVFGQGAKPLEPTDLALILDTNDGRLVEPLFTELKNKCKETLFIDHHPVLIQGPAPTVGSLIDIAAASTGELCFHLLRILKIPLDASIARALYTSVVFDTQLFRYVKSHPSSHLMAAELLAFEREPELVHRKLFANYTVEKLAFLTRSLTEVEYLAEDRIAFIPVRAAAFLGGGLDRDESGDIIDTVINIGTVEIAALLREDGPGLFKLSLRSKGTVEVLSLAEKFGGGGHRYASGAHLKGEFSEIRESLIKCLHQLVPAVPPARRSGT
jgi:phosphoesterase RecJ-like protein